MRPEPEKVRVAIVDDSSTMRSWLRHLIEQDERLDVVAEACSADEAREVIKATNPDVITLDIEMPKMNGLEFLKRLMRLRPMPVVMVSSLTKRGSAEAIHAFSLGAIDCICKPQEPRDIDAKHIQNCIFQASAARVHGWTGPTKKTGDLTVDQESEIDTDQIFLIGSSTGGVTALEAFLSDIPRHAPPIVIAQHMPDHFLKSFATRLDSQFPQNVAVADHNEELSAGMIRLAPSGGVQTAVSYSRGRWSIQLEKAEGYESFSPSVDHLFYSAVSQGTQVVAAILTGLGDDGARALRALRDEGARTFGQNEESCVVYGMPKAAKAAGAVEVEAGLPKIASLMMQQVKPRTLG